MLIIVLGRRLLGSISFFTLTLLSTSVPGAFRVDPDPVIRTIGDGSGSGSCSFLRWLSWCKKKNRSFFCWLLTEVHLHQTTKIQIIKKSQNWRNQRVLDFLLVDGRTQEAQNVRIRNSAFDPLFVGWQREANCLNYLKWACGVCRAAEGGAWDGGEPGESLQLRVPGLPLAPRGGSLHTDGGRQGGIHLSLPHFQPPDVLPRYRYPVHRFCSNIWLVL